MVEVEEKGERVIFDNINEVDVDVDVDAGEHQTLVVHHSSHPNPLLAAAVVVVVIVIVEVIICWPHLKVIFPLQA